jgi:hypothetical protein
MRNCVSLPSFFGPFRVYLMQAGYDDTHHRRKKKTKNPNRHIKHIKLFSRFALLQFKV